MKSGSPPGTPRNEGRGSNEPRLLTEPSPGTLCNAVLRVRPDPTRSFFTPHPFLPFGVAGTSHCCPHLLLAARVAFLRPVPSLLRLCFLTAHVQVCLPLPSPGFNYPSAGEPHVRKLLQALTSLGPLDASSTSSVPPLCSELTSSFSFTRHQQPNQCPTPESRLVSFKTTCRRTSKRQPDPLIPR